ASRQTDIKIDCFVSGNNTATGIAVLSRTIRDKCIRIEPPFQCRSINVRIPHKHWSLSSTDQSSVSASRDGQRSSALNPEDGRHLPAACYFLQRTRFECRTANDRRRVYIVPPIGTTTRAIGLAAMWILEVHTIKELISIGVVDAM